MKEEYNTERQRKRPLQEDAQLNNNENGVNTTWDITQEGPGFLSGGRSFHISYN